MFQAFQMAAQVPETPKGKKELESVQCRPLATPGRNESHLSSLVRHFSRTPRPALDANAMSPRFISNRVSPHLDGDQAKQGSLSEINCMLRTHQADLMSVLQEWIASHEDRLERMLGDFQEFLTRSRTFDSKLNASGSKLISLPKLKRSAKVGTGFSSKSGLFRTESEPASPSREVSDPWISQRASQRRPSIDSADSLNSCGNSKYVSVEELRIQCLTSVPSGISGTPMGMGSRTLSWDSTEKSCGCTAIIMRLCSVVNSFYFELFFASLICVNSVLLGVEVAVVSESPAKQVPHVFYYLTILFTTAFLVELLMRLVSEGGLIAFLCYSTLRMWNWFDLFVIMCSLVEVGFNFVLLGGGSQSVTRIMRMARMTRLGRVLRVARIVRFISQLRVLVISIMSTLQTLLWALFLLVIIIYVFAVLLAQATAEHFSEDPAYNKGDLVGNDELLEHYWGSLHGAMYTLFMSVAGGVSWEAAVFAIGEIHWIWGAIFTCYIAFGSFALINVMTAVFCQSAIESAQKSLDVKWQRMCADKHKHIEHLKKLFQSIANNKRGTISVQKLQKCWNDEAMQQFLLSMDLAPDDCWTFFAILDAKRDHDVSAAEFVEGCLRLKGGAKAFDMAVMKYELRHLSKQNIAFMNSMHERMNTLLMETVGETDISPPVYETEASDPNSPKWGGS